MLERLQRNQIVKASEGETSLLPAMAWHDSSGALGIAALETLRPAAAAEQAHSPQKAVPFEDFYKMFQEYGSEKQREKEAQRRQQHHHLPTDEGYNHRDGDMGRDSGRAGAAAAKAVGANGHDGRGGKGGIISHSDGHCELTD
jgi:hypothetical protein